MLSRDVSIDYLRSMVTVFVVVHHASLAYTTFSQFDPWHYKEATAPVVDAARFAPLALLAGFNDLYFMALMFLVSGLFVAPSLNRKGLGRFLSDRAKRLGLPFVVGTIILSPMTFYASWLLSAYADRGRFLSDFFAGGTWNPGPLWFLSVLLIFCCIVVLMLRFIPGLVKKMAWTAGSPSNLTLVFVVTALATTIPTALAAWPPVLILIGPVGMAFPSRIFLYFAYFLLGMALGAADMATSLSRENLRYWPVWLGAGILSYLVHGSAPAILPGLSRGTIAFIQALAMSFCCAFTILALFGMSRRFFARNWSLADSLSDNAFGIYILHYFFVIWIQYLLLPRPYPAFAKFLISFSGALAASWISTALLRRTVLGKVL